MKFSQSIFKNLNEYVEDASQANYAEFNNQIALLIKDEEEAIAGYESALTILQNEMTDYQNNEIAKVLLHIISEEEEHIKELNALKNDLDITSWK